MIVLSKNCNLMTITVAAKRFAQQDALQLTDPPSRSHPRYLKVHNFIINSDWVLARKFNLTSQMTRSYNYSENERY